MNFCEYGTDVTGLPAGVDHTIVPSAVAVLVTVDCWNALTVVAAKLWPANSRYAV